MFAVVEREVVASLPESASCAGDCLVSGIEVIVLELKGLYELPELKE